MSGKFNGVQALLREMCKHPCIYVHCYAHRLNLVLVDTCSEVKCAGDLIGILQVIYAFVSVSSLRHGKLAALQVASNLCVLEMPKQSDTRWVCKLKAVSMFKDRLKQVVQLLQFYSVHGKPSERAESTGLLHQINLTLVFMLHVMEEILSLVNALSKYLQGKNASMFHANSLVQATTKSVASMRNEETFCRLLTSATELCKSCDIFVPDPDPSHSVEPPARQSRINPNLLGCVVMSTLGQRTGLVNVKVAAESDHILNLRRDMFEVVDRVCNEMNRRFASNAQYLISCDTIDPSSERFMNYECMKPLADMYAYLNIDSAKLKYQATVAKELLVNSVCSATTTDTNTDTSSSTTPSHTTNTTSSSSATGPNLACDQQCRNVADVLKTLNTMKYGERFVFPDLVAFVNLVSTLPISSAQAERTFSTMKRVKNYLRASMSDDRLSDLCLLSLERDMSSQLMVEPQPMVEAFAVKSNRRIQFL